MTLALQCSISYFPSYDTIYLRTDGRILLLCAKLSVVIGLSQKRSPKSCELRVLSILELYLTIFNLKNSKRLLQICSGRFFWKFYKRQISKAVQQVISSSPEYSFDPFLYISLIRQKRSPSMLAFKGSKFASVDINEIFWMQFLITGIDCSMSSKLSPPLIFFKIFFCFSESGRESSEAHIYLGIPTIL